MLTHPAEKVPYLDFANFSYNHCSFQVGIDVLNSGLMHLSQDADLYQYRGILYCKLGDTAKGIADFETANRLDPALPFTTVAEGVAESQAHDSAGAVATFRAVARRRPRDPLTQYLFAEALFREDKPEGTPADNEEVKAVALAVKLDPSSSQARDLLATVYLQTGKIDLAIEQSQSALLSDPNDQQLCIKKQKSLPE